MSSIRRNRNFPSLWSLTNDVLAMGRLFDDSRFWNESLPGPAVNIIESDTAFELQMAAPGLEKNDFKVELVNNLLLISADHKPEKDKNTGDFTRQEFSYTSFFRSFKLPDYVNAEKMDVRCKDGILTLTLSKNKKPSPEREIFIG